MGKTIAEKILSEKSGKDIYGGDFVVADVDVCFAHSANRPLSIEVYEKMGLEGLFDPKKIVLINGHEPVSGTPQVANKQKKFREFAEASGVNYYELGDGTTHAVMTENGHVTPGDLIVGTDSHSCTYGALNAFGTAIGSSEAACVMNCGKNWFRVPESIRINLVGNLPDGVYSKDIILSIINTLNPTEALYRAVEFGGPAVSALSMDARFTLCNMCVDLGAKTALMEADDKTFAFLEGRARKAFTPVFSDPDAVYVREITIDVSELEPLVAKPHSSRNLIAASSIEPVPVNIAILGTCTNGRIEDLRIGADIIRGKKLPRGVRLYVIPSSREILLQALEDGIIEDYVKAGAIIGSPGCNGCGSAFACPGDGEVIISSANRNFKGRKGNKNGFVYLASPATVVSSALAGHITDCRNYM